MKILLLGSGGREHALAWKMQQSPLCEALFIAPGNAGTNQVGKNVELNPLDFAAVKAFVLDQKIDLVLVGPEAPLVAGIFDFFQQDADLQQVTVIGPSQEGAQLEGSKAYGKEFMQEFGIPTAGYREFTAETLAEGLAYIETQTPPIVLKADGLAAGKGVLIIDNHAEAQMELRAMLDGKFGEASAKVVIEEFLDGIEFSVFALTDGKDYILLPNAKDYKRIGEGDTGLNTGGMGSVSPVSFATPELMEKVVEKIVKPTINGINTRGFRYDGFVFFGLIIVKNEPYVIEYNCRMGDPETETVMPRLKSDLVAHFAALRAGKLGEEVVEIDERAATAVFLVSGGYPEAYEKGKVMTGLNDVKDSILFHAGTKQVGDDIVTNGGRVLAITSYGETFQNALKISQKNAAVIDFAGKNFRTDIGFDL